MSCGLVFEIINGGEGFIAVGIVTRAFLSARVVRCFLRLLEESDSFILSYPSRQMAHIGVILHEVSVEEVIHTHF